MNNPHLMSSSELIKFLGSWSFAQALSNLSQDELDALRARSDRILALPRFLGKHAFKLAFLCGLAAGMLVWWFNDGVAMSSIAREATAFMMGCMVFAVSAVFGFGAVSCIYNSAEWVNSQLKPLGHLYEGCESMLKLCTSNSLAASYRESVAKQGREFIIADLSMVRDGVRLEGIAKRAAQEKNACMSLHGFSEAHANA